MTGNLRQTKWVIHSDRKILDEAAADILIDVLNKVQNPVIGFATGSSPLGVYQSLVKRSLASPALLERWSHVHGFNLDEYVGLSEQHEQSYHAYMWNHLYQFLPVKPENIHVPNGNGDLISNCLAYDEALAEHGWPDVQILGIGKNGHIGFNEPAQTLSLHTHVTDLTENTRSANARFFTNEQEVPTQAITMGIADILQARQIILLAFGEEKREALIRSFSGSVSTLCPASFLQMHANVTVLTDKEVPELK
jgi:glucosamine-6-phosphate deaminase